MTTLAVGDVITVNGPDGNSVLCRVTEALPHSDGTNTYVLRPEVSLETVHGADLYHEDNGVLPTCQCGWKGAMVPTYDEAADAYAEHRIAGGEGDA